MTNLNFDENTYLQQHPDVAEAVAEGRLGSGFEHWVRFGFNEGRTPQIRLNEQFYLDFHPDVSEAVNNGDFASGFEHYALFGASENRASVGSATRQGSQLQEILERGFLRVAVNDDAIGFTNQEADGSFSGMGIDYSRALATALFDNPNAIEFVVVEAGEDFNSVASGTVDIAATLPTHSVGLHAGRFFCTSVAHSVEANRETSPTFCACCLLGQRLGRNFPTKQGEP